MESGRRKLGVLAAASAMLLCSFKGCQWGPEEEKRFCLAQDLACRNLRESAVLHLHLCDRLSLENRERCILQFLDFWRRMNELKIRAANAYANCDASTLRQIQGVIDSMHRLLREVNDVWRPIPRIEFDNLMGVFAAPVAWTVDGDLTAGVLGSARTEYVVRPTSAVAIDWAAPFFGSGQQLETFGVSGDLVLETSGLTPPFQIGQQYQIRLLGGRLTVDGGGLLGGAETAFVVDESRVVDSSVIFDGSRFVGELRGYYDFGDPATTPGVAAMKLPIEIASGGATISLSTPGLVDPDTVWPRANPDPGDRIYYFLPETELRSGGTTNFHAEHMDPFGGFAIFVSAGLEEVPGSLFGVPWDIEQSSQVLMSLTATDFAGRSDFELAVPADPNLIGRRFAFQGLGVKEGRLVSTLPVIDEVRR